MDNSVKKREWVKTAAIIFLAILLVLTFFSRTIMNASLPEVAAQQVSSGAINARIRGTAAVEANEVYNVTIKQTRKVASVMATVGQQVNVGDVLFVLEAEESDELKQAELDLESLQQTYDKSLIEAGNTSAKDNREVQKARDAYNEALAIYNQYSTSDPTRLATQKAAAEAKLKDLQTEKTAIDNQLTKLKGEKEYSDAQAVVTKHEATVKSLEDEKAKLLETLPASYADCNNANYYQEVIDAITRSEDYIRCLARYEKNFSAFSSLCDDEYAIMKECYENEESMRRRIEGGSPKSLVDEDGNVVVAATTEETAEIYREAFKALAPYYYGYGKAHEDGLFPTQDKLKVATINDKIAEANAAMSTAQTIVGNYERSFESLEAQSEQLDQQITDQQTTVDKLTSASSAAETVKTTKEALEDLIFTQGLGDSTSIDMEASKKSIERKQAEIEKLRANADEVEVKSTVVGTVGSISVTAGTTAGADTPLATINVTDRGYTVKIEVDTEQAKKVRVGDTAELVNFWGGDVTATLDKISGSQNQGKKTLEFKITGDIEPGQNVTLSIGQKSANYDALVPLSALHEDSNGKFVYVMTTKSSPLGNRYIATRVTVQELARDDKSAAVSGVSMGDFVITTSDKPFDAGSQVRLADNG